MKFFIGIDDPDSVHNPEGYCSSDEYKLLVQPFMELYFTYVEKFVCILVCPDDENGDLAKAYGFPFELKPEVIDEIAIVCAGDFQNVVYAAYCDLLRGKDINKYVECFEVLPNDEDRAPREKILMKAISKAKEAGRPYAEARLYRPLRRTDCVDPDSGKTVYVALVLLEEDDED
jgi:hypothetical protein